MGLGVSSWSWSSELELERGEGSGVSSWSWSSELESGGVSHKIFRNSDGWQSGFTNVPPRVSRNTAMLKVLFIA